MEKNKNLWIPGDAARFSELKRSLPLFVNDSKPELVCNKKKAIEDVNSRAVSGTPNVDISSWEYAPNFQPGFGIFSDRLYGQQSAWSYDSPASRNMSRLAATDYDKERSSLGKEVGSDSTIAFSVSDHVNNPISFLNFGDPDYLLNQIDEYDWFSENAFAGGVTCNKANEILTSTSQTFETGSGYIGQVDPTHNEVSTDVLSMETTYDNVDSSIASLDHTINESDGSFLYLERFQYDPPADKPSGRTDRSYDLVRSQSLVQPSEILPRVVGMKDYSLPNLEPNVDITAASISKNEDITRTKVKKKTTTQKKSGNMGQTTQTLFPPNVRSMLATGVFDGIPVKYVSSSRDMSLDGIIRGGNYLCACKGCNGHKALTASEFEIHAGSKTKQPNRRIYFENGKSVAEAVHELRSTPASEILEVTKTISGSPIDEARLCMWKDAYEAATAGATKFRSKG